MKKKSTPLKDPDLKQDLSNKKDYEKTLKEWQLKLTNLHYRLRDQTKNSVILVFEGLDAAGKGGAIKRLTEELDPRGFSVHPIGAPSEEELRFHYLKRFWINIPPAGHLTIFDRSWYGRVLVERVDKLAKKEDWKRAYKEISHFEKTLADNGAILIKFWLQVSKKEQLKRFHEREKDPFKKYKITKEDWHNRKHWGDYLKASAEMIEKTHTEQAPWFVVEGDDKNSARIQVMQTIVEKLTQFFK